MNSPATRISFWMLPAEPVRSVLQSMIDHLGRRFDAPTFTPHVTLYNGTAVREKSIDALRDVAARSNLIRLDPVRVSYGDEWTKTLYVEFVPEPALAVLAKSLQQDAGAVNAYELQPHLSLIYAALAIETKQALAREIPLPEPIWFDEVRAVLTPGRTCSRADVEQWRVLASAQLKRHRA